MGCASWILETDHEQIYADEVGNAKVTLHW